MPRWQRCASDGNFLLMGNTSMKSSVDKGELSLRLSIPVVCALVVILLGVRGGLLWALSS